MLWKNIKINCRDARREVLRGPANKDIDQFEDLTTGIIGSQQSLENIADDHDLQEDD